jgi:hypothetical protein
LSGKPLILILLILLTGCSALKTSKTKQEYISTRTSDINKIRSQNLSVSDFNIKKAEVEINTGGEKQKLLASVKYKIPGLWLISLKSNTGIEVARAFITKDTILINDRLHKKMYYGNISVMEIKYGIPFIALPVLFGDFIERGIYSADSTRCIEGKNIKTIELNKYKTEYFISCRENKIINSKINNDKKREILIAYSKIKTNENKKYPTIIVLRYPEQECIIEIKIRNIDFTNIEKIDFFPGKGYENILLK